jgi:hypothetical protein
MVCAHDMYVYEVHICMSCMWYMFDCMSCTKVVHICSSISICTQGPKVLCARMPRSDGVHMCSTQTTTTIIYKNYTTFVKEI